MMDLQTVAKCVVLIVTTVLTVTSGQQLSKPYVFTSKPYSHVLPQPSVLPQSSVLPQPKQKRFVLVPKGPHYGSHPMVLNHMEVQDLPPGNYDIVALYDEPKFDIKVPSSSSLPPRRSPGYVKFNSEQQSHKEPEYRPTRAYQEPKYTKPKYQPTQKPKYYTKPSPPQYQQPTYAKPEYQPTQSPTYYTKPVPTRYQKEQQYSKPEYHQTLKYQEYSTPGYQPTPNQKYHKQEHSTPKHHPTKYQEQEYSSKPEYRPTRLKEPKHSKPTYRPTQDHRYLDEPRIVFEDPVTKFKDPEVSVPKEHANSNDQTSYRSPKRITTHQQFLRPPNHDYRQTTPLTGFRQQQQQPERILQEEQRPPPRPATPPPRQHTTPDPPSYYYDYDPNYEYDYDYEPNEQFRYFHDQTQRNRGIFVTPIPPPSETNRNDRKIDRANKHQIERPRYKRKQDTLQKLFEIAGTGDNVDGAGRSTIPKQESFVCPHDGHFGDSKDCTKFYRCAHGTAQADYCPAGLFWNDDAEQCDWPDNTVCTFDSAKAKEKKVTRPTFLYMTFDDGPNEGTPYVLDILRKHNVRATFFINSDNLEINPKKPGQAEQNAEVMLQIIADGHVLADHSYDHMNHNSHDSPKNAYQDLEEDLSYFGDYNARPILDLMWNSGMREPNIMGFVNHTMSTIVRMPYTNAWRVDKIKHDCFPCTVPARSGRLGIEISQALASSGKAVFGWDKEWSTNWNINRLRHDGSSMYGRLNARHTKSPQKVILLMHDVAFRPANIPKDLDHRELDKFVDLAKASGYTFSTLDNYTSDDPY